MFCAERLRLLAEYDTAVKKLTAAAQTLAKVAGSFEYDVYQKAWKESETARAVCLSLTNRIEDHVRNHHCKEDDPAH